MTAAKNQTAIDCHHTLGFHNGLRAQRCDDISGQRPRGDRAQQM